MGILLQAFAVAGVYGTEIIQDLNPKVNKRATHLAQRVRRTFVYMVLHFLIFALDHIFAARFAVAVAVAAGAIIRRPARLAVHGLT